MRVSRATRVLATLAAAVVGMAGLVVVVSATPAAAATICSAYTNGEVWMTSTRWGRVRERVCLEYTSTQVRGRVQFQVDYPLSCTLTVGLPPSAGVSCPSHGTRVGNLDFLGTKITVGIKRGSTTARFYTCTGGSWDGDYLQTMTRTCVTPYFTDSYSSYRIYAQDVMGDVKSDGDGWKVLAPVSWLFAAP